MKKEKFTHKEPEKTEHMQTHQENDSKAWTGRSQSQVSRYFGEDDTLSARRFQHKTEVNIAVERAKQRKEEEEKKFQEVKQKAAKKLQELEERKRDKDQEEGQGTINPMIVPPKPIVPTSVPVPDWEKDKDRYTRNSDYGEEKQKSAHRDAAFDFKQMTQIEGKVFGRKDSRSGFDRDRERSREMNGPTFSKLYHNDLPPRFQKQMKNNTNTSPQPSIQFGHQYDNRWLQNNSNSKASPPQTNRKRDDLSDKERDDDRRDYRRQGSDDSYRSSNKSYSESGRKSVSENR